MLELSLRGRVPPADMADDGVPWDAVVLTVVLVVSLSVSALWDQKREEFQGSVNICSTQ